MKWVWFHLDWLSFIYCYNIFSCSLPLIQINPWKAISLWFVEWNETKQKRCGSLDWWMSGLWGGAHLRHKTIHSIHSHSLIVFLVLPYSFPAPAKPEPLTSFNSFLFQTILIYSIIFLYLYNILSSQLTKQRERVGFPLFVGCWRAWEGYGNENKWNQTFLVLFGGMSAAAKPRIAPQFHYFPFHQMNVWLHSHFANTFTLISFHNIDNNLKDSKLKRNVRMNQPLANNPKQIIVKTNNRKN